MIQLKVNKVHMLAFILSPTLCCAEMFFYAPFLACRFLQGKWLIFLGPEFSGVSTGSGPYEDGMIERLDLVLSSILETESKWKCALLSLESSSIPQTFMLCSDQEEFIPC